MSTPRLNLRASEAHCWTVCTAAPGFLLANHHLVEDDSSSYAEEGTLAHLHAAETLLLGYNAKDFGRNREMADHIFNYSAFVWSRMGPGCKMEVEQNTPLFYMPERKSFIDTSIVKPKGLEIIDLKYGAGVSVQAEDNPQLIIYGRSKIELLKAKGRKFKPGDKVELVIWQPRVYGEDAERRFEISVKELMELSDEIHVTADTIRANVTGSKKAQVKFVPGDKQCQFCKAKAFCGHHANHILGGLPVETADLLDAPKQGVKMPVPEVLTLDQVSSILRSRKGIEKLFAACENYIFRKLMHGEEAPDWKVVSSKTHRVWKGDETDITLFLEGLLPHDEVWLETEPKLLSPAQAETALKRARKMKREDPRWDTLRSLIEKPKGGPTLAPKDDPRKPWEDDSLEGFEVIEDD